MREAKSLGGEVEEPESGLKINNGIIMYLMTLWASMKSLSHFLFLIKKSGHLGNPCHCLLPLSYILMANYELM